MANGRCRRHGGKSTGAGNPARPGNQNAVTHGIYSKFVDRAAVEEAELLESLEPAERARMGRLLRERRMFKALGNDDAPLQAVNQLVDTVLAHLDPPASEGPLDADGDGGAAGGVHLHFTRGPDDAR